MNSIRFYSNNKPKEKELVRFKITNRNDHDLECILLDYNCKGCMTYKDATKKKRVKHMSMFKLNKELYGLVETIGKVIQLSTRYNDIDSKDWSELKETSYLNNKLISMFKMLSLRLKSDFNELWEKYVYPIDKQRIEDKSNLNLYNYFEENYRKYFDDKQIEYIENFYQKNKKVETKKLITKFKLVSNFSIETTKEILEESFKINKNKKIKILLDAPPSYYIESLSNNSTLEEHEKIINEIKKNASNRKSNFQLVN